MTFDQQRQVLRTLAARFNASGLRWQVGASMLLYLKGVVERAGDLDLIVDERDYLACKEILAELGFEKAVSPHPMFRSAQFSTFEVEGVEIDLMAAYTVHFVGGMFTYPFEPQYAEILEDQGVSIYMAPLEFWLVTYRCMGDPKGRVPLIWAYFDRQGYDEELVAVAKSHVKKTPRDRS